MNPIRHYLKLLDFFLHRFEGSNYQNMREYFANILIQEISPHLVYARPRLLDIGGGKGEFCKVIKEKLNCSLALNLDLSPDPGIWDLNVVGNAYCLPFSDNEFDIVICRGVIEHIPREFQFRVFTEIKRVMSANGLAYIMVPPWFSFHGGHSIKPFHIFSFPVAKALKNLLFKTSIEGNSYADLGLYPLTFDMVLKAICRSDLKVIRTMDTHFKQHWITRIPVLREILVPSAVFLVRK